MPRNEKKTGENVGTTEIVLLVIVGTVCLKVNAVKYSGENFFSLYYFYFSHKIIIVVYHNCI